MPLLGPTPPPPVTFEPRFRHFSFLGCSGPSRRACSLQLEKRFETVDETVDAEDVKDVQGTS